MLKIYWFKRKGSGEIFCVEGEKAASQITKRKDFKEKMEYVGFSSGKKFAEIIAKKRKLTEKEKTTLQQKSAGLDAGRRKLITQAIQAEINEAIKNKDKTMPVYSRVSDLDGSLVRNGIFGQVKSMFGG